MLDRFFSFDRSSGGGGRRPSWSRSRSWSLSGSVNTTTHLCVSSLKCLLDMTSTTNRVLTDVVGGSKGDVQDPSELSNWLYHGASTDKDRQRQH